MNQKINFYETQLFFCTLNARFSAYFKYFFVLVLYIKFHLTKAISFNVANFQGSLHFSGQTNLKMRSEKLSSRLSQVPQKRLLFSTRKKICVSLGVFCYPITFFSVSFVYSFTLRYAFPH